MKEKYVYMFNEGNASMRNILGGKGANIAEMIGLGLPVPNGFTISTKACALYNLSKTIPDNIKTEIETSIKNLETSTGKKLGDFNNPLLVSVRSGSRASMPGMMDTVLNLGLNDQVVEGLARLTNNPRFAYDSYRRFIMMFADVVIGLSKQKFDKILDEYKKNACVVQDYELNVDQLKEIVIMFKKIYKEEYGSDFPTDTRTQLYETIAAVFRSWDNPHAFVYRRMNDIPYDWGTAVNVQSMVFGNMGNDSGTGVIFTRNPANGENKIYGEYMLNAQGEDVVAGVRTPKYFEELKNEMPDIYEECCLYAKKLEKHYKDIQDMEITIENNKLYILQTRNAKRTAQSAVKIAVDLVEEGLINKEKAIMMIEPRQLDQLLHPIFNSKTLINAVKIGKALPASPGAGAGQIYFDAEDAKIAYEKGNRVILVRNETSPKDIVGMEVSKGVLTACGGMTSHAAVVARGMGRCCISGCESIVIDEDKKQFELSGKIYKEGDYISLDGTTGIIYEGDLKTSEPIISDNFNKLMSWADEIRTIKVYANAETCTDVAKAVKFGAEGIGLVRTEHMFFQPDRIFKMRTMIFADNVDQRKEALDDLLSYQISDFVQIYESMEGKPVTVRLLDPPLHEFLTNSEDDYLLIGKKLSKTLTQLQQRRDALYELNPMMGHRGCRLAVTYPEIAQMQTRAIIEAAIEVNKKGLNIIPEIMIPLIGHEKELKYVKDIITNTADEVIKNNSVNLKYIIGTMIEIPRAAFVADKIAEDAEFFSFGTNDLSQLTYGLSRDDAGKILKDYIEKGIYEYDPTSKIDELGVGQLIKIAIEKGLSTRPNLKLGVCGEHGGDPASINFFYKIGLNYVSCSPYRVPIARLAAAQAVIINK